MLPASGLCELKAKSAKDVRAVASWFPCGGFPQSALFFFLLLSAPFPPGGKDLGRSSDKDLEFRGTPISLPISGSSPKLKGDMGSFKV